MTSRGPGPDHDLYPHRPRPGRAPLRWPNGARTALVIFLYFETWDLDAPPDALRDTRLDGPLGGIAPNIRPYTQYEFGNRVGIFRVLALLDRLGLKATVAANSQACVRIPFLVNEFRRRHYEFAAHGPAVNRMMSSRMTPADQRAAIADALTAIAQATGARPTGWMSQDYGGSEQTPQRLADAGLSYVADWANDDQPYPMRTDPPLWSLPNQAEWDDVQIMHHRGVSPAVWGEGVTASFDRLHQEGGAFFGVHIHPWLTGMPHRIGTLETALGHIAAAPDVWRATAGEVACHMKNAMP
jgi:peptidoglycan/xylan/chitin deacetylase (PgdA/CDA1 family)